eukprot:UN30339
MGFFNYDGSGNISYTTFQILCSVETQESDFVHICRYLLKISSKEYKLFVKNSVEKRREYLKLLSRTISLVNRTTRMERVVTVSEIFDCFDVYLQGKLDEVNFRGGLETLKLQNSSFVQQTALFYKISKGNSFVTRSDFERVHGHKRCTYSEFRETMEAMIGSLSVKETQKAKKRQGRKVGVIEKLRQPHTVLGFPLRRDWSPLEKRDASQKRELEIGMTLDIDREKSKADFELYDVAVLEYTKKEDESAYCDLYELVPIQKINFLVVEHAISRLENFLGTSFGDHTTYSCMKQAVNDIKLKMKKTQNLKNQNELWKRIIKKTNNLVQEFDKLKKFIISCSIETNGWTMVILE